MKIAYVGKYGEFEEWLAKLPIKTFNKAKRVAILEDESTVYFVSLPRDIVGLEIDKVFIGDAREFTTDDLEMIQSRIRPK